MFENIDWNGIAITILLWILPVLAGMAVRYIFTVTKSELENLKASKPDLVNYIEIAAKFSVQCVEQLRKSGVIPTTEEAKQRAVELVESSFES